MVKRKCGTCRHFKDGGIAGSGWCQHPARKDIQHMVLVRKTELACRNSWDQDLWDLAEQPLELQPSQTIPVPISGGESRDIQIARADVAEDDAVRQGEMFTDRITSISMPTRSQLRPGRASASQDDTDEDGGTDTELQIARSSVREARKRRQEQRHLERRKHQETILQQAGDLLDRRDPESSSDRELARLRADDGPLTAKRERRSEPPAEKPQLPPAPRREPTPSRPEPTPSVEFGATPPRFRGASEPPRVPKQRDEPSGGMPSKSQNGHHAETPLRRGETEPLPSAEDVRRAVKQQQVPARSAATMPSPQRSSARRMAAPEGAPIDLPPPVVDRTPNYYTGAGHIAAPPVREAPPPKSVDPIDVADALASIRRCCATCRDFKQSGDGRTGWCTNPYAFRDKRMVQSDEIACRSSLGVWWLPHDGFWLEQADTTHHGRPTPLLDDVLGAASTERQGMGQRSSSMRGD